MAFWCIDPVDGNDGTGASNATQSVAETTPYKTLSAVETATPAAGDSILFKGGTFLSGIQTLDTGTDGSAGSPITFGSYGTGYGGVDANGDLAAIDTNQNVYLTFNGIELKGGGGVGNANLNISGATEATAVNIIVDGCKIHGGTDDDGTGDNQGIDCRASNVEVYDNEIYDVYDDGIYNHGNNTVFHHNYIHDVDKSAGVKSGDCLKFSSSGTCTNAHAHHNILDHSSSGRKQALIIAGTGAGMLGEHNKCIGGEICIALKGTDASGGIARRNLCNPESIGTYNGVSIAETSGIRAEGAGQVLESNIVHTANGKEVSYGLWIAGDTTAIQGNVVYCALNGAATGALLRGSGARTYDTIRNNIFGGNLDSEYLIYIPRVNFTITGISTHATDPVITTENNHTLKTGDSAVISGVSTGTFTGGYGVINTTHTITVTGVKTFTVTGIECTVAATDGSGYVNSILTECDYNIYLNDGKFHYNGTTYANLAAWKAAGFDANSPAIIDKDTLFEDADNGDFRIKSGQAVTGSQVRYRDFLGRVNFPTIIGAYIQQTMISSTGNSVDTTAGTVDTTIGTVLSGAKVGGSSVYGDAVKYPEWGIRS